MKQMRYNEEHGIVPKQIKKKINTLLDNEELKQTREQFAFNAPDKKTLSANASATAVSAKASDKNRMVADDTDVEFHSLPFLETEVERTKEKMMAAAKALDFMEAAHLRDYMLMLQERIEKIKANSIH